MRCIEVGISTKPTNLLLSYLIKLLKIKWISFKDLKKFLSNVNFYDVFSNVYLSGLNVRKYCFFC